MSRDTTREIERRKGEFFNLKKKAYSNESGQNRLEWLEILEMLWHVKHLIFKTSSVTPDVFYVFNIILLFSTLSQS